MILFSEPIPVEIVNQGSSIFSAPNVISIVSLLVSFSAAWYQWRSNGPRVNIWYSIYGPHVIPDGDRTYPKATLTIHVANKGRTETTVEPPLMHTGSKPRLEMTVLPTGPWRHAGNGGSNHFPAGAMAAVDIYLSEIVAFTPLMVMPVKDLFVEVVTTDKVINKKLPKDIAKIIQGWIDQCSESEDKD